MPVVVARFADEQIVFRKEIHQGQPGEACPGLPEKLPPRVAAGRPVGDES
jgi:hypothetical protein